MYKVFMNDKPIIFIDSFKKRNNFVLFDMKIWNLENVIKVLAKKEVEGVFLFVENLSEDWELFKKEFKVVEAAGGKVLNNNKEVLFIYRFDKWDLPKGHIEKGEDKETAAIREVEEECGVNELKIISPLETTYHTFYFKEEWRLKVTYWYLMKTDYSGALVPQEEEGITDVLFKNEMETEVALKNTYPNIKLLF
ncbi:NUDIX hydrolase [Flavicella sediminum]|uniref:NUDIX hydrolase n=1 Tax=Flavicella sediminum TaxID=2585141 RepID=UPI001AA074BE|nr:NUDIX domain-containing protein [Flavicella sediminum]